MGIHPRDDGEASTTPVTGPGTHIAIGGAVRPGRDMTRSVWLVTSGSYSDYTVDWAFDTESEAQRVAEALGTDYGVEEFEILESAGEQAELLRLWLFPPAHGDYRPLVREYRKPVFPSLTPVPEVEAVEDRPGLSWLLEVSGTDHARVRKSFMERTARICAGKGLVMPSL
jgi:hypothetical protein